MKKIRGFFDSHLHVLGIGFNMNTINLSKLKSTSEIPHINVDQEKDIIFGRGYHEQQFVEKCSPTKHDLDKLSKDKPVIFLRVCGHVLVCNSKAMEVAGIDETSKQIQGGTFDVETGIFTEDALQIITSIMPKPNKQEIKEMFIKANDYLLSQGITRVASDDFSTLGVDYEIVIEALKECYDEGKMQLVYVEQVNLPSIELLQDFIDKGYVNKDFGRFKMGPLKLLADGSLGGKTAYMNDPYINEDHQGVKVFDDETLFQMIHLADTNNMDVAIHAIGDGMVDIVLDAIERSYRITKRAHNHSIIHAQLANRRQIERMKALGVGAIVQPIFINSDIPIVKDYIGEERFLDSYLFHTMMTSGVTVGFSTDAPVEDVNPFENLYVALTNRSIKYPELGVFHEHECFSLEESLMCYTTNNDRLNNMYLVDVTDEIVLSCDIHQSSPSAIKDCVVLETWIDGVLVYKR